jgi:hypothetical protein
MKKLAILCLMFCTTSACVGSKVIDVKSPCVSTSDGPCGPKKSINDWWLNGTGINS